MPDVAKGAQQAEGALTPQPPRATRSQPEFILISPPPSKPDMRYSYFSSQAGRAHTDCARHHLSITKAPTDSIRAPTGSILARGSMTNRDN